MQTRQNGRDRMDERVSGGNQIDFLGALVQIRIERANRCLRSYCGLKMLLQPLPSPFLSLFLALGLQESRLNCLLCLPAILFSQNHSTG